MSNRVFAFLILTALIPVFLIISIIIFLDNGSPIFFTQKRVGINDTFFRLYKFRTMRKDTPNIATNLLQEPKKYLLKTGRVLRKFSLDELPNLYNILKGEMLFVGPRPALYNQYELIQLRNDAGINKLKPGLTGWAQINGRDNISLKEKVALDKQYLENKNLILDLRILILTFISAFIKKEGIKH